MTKNDFENAQTFLANLKSTIRNHEKIRIGGGIFSGEELKSVAAVIENGMRLPLPQSAPLVETDAEPSQSARPRVKP